MSRTSVEFDGQSGTLVGALELPATPPRGFALFAHCFTCGKDSIAAARISRNLAEKGIGVLRFDFTGLGDSEGEFGNAGFSSNIDDLVAAADFLRRSYQAPTLLIGHSLGGTAVLAAAAGIEECEAVVTIGAPASPDHVIQQFGANVDQIERHGRANVTLAGRDFPIEKSFLDDLRAHPMSERIHELRRALLIMHSPLDDIVDVSEASAIFDAALHPKSFVSLDRADHLLRRPEDAQFVADTIAGWASRYFPPPGESTGDVSAGHVRVGEENHRFLRSIASDDHHWLADEPTATGGDNLGPDPYEHLLAALGSCTSMTIRLYANRKQWPLDDVEIELEHFRDHGADCERCEEPEQVIDVIARRIRLEGKLDAEQRARLLEIADRCPVHKTLTGELRIETDSSG